MWPAGTARSPTLHCWNPLTQPFVARQLPRNIRVVQVCRCPLPHPSGVVDTPQASACSRSRRASISERRGSVPCISPCCERLQTTAATLKARGGALHPHHFGHLHQVVGRQEPGPVPGHVQSLALQSSVRLPSRARARPRVESGAVVLGAPRFRHRSRLPVRPSFWGRFCGERRGAIIFSDLHRGRCHGPSRSMIDAWADRPGIHRRHGRC